MFFMSEIYTEALSSFSTRLQEKVCAFLNDAAIPFHRGGD